MRPTPSTTPEPRTDWQELSRRLLRIATALTRDAAEAEDLTQQTLAVLLARRPDMADHLGFARRTLTRLWLDRRRSLARRINSLRRLVLTAVASRPSAPETKEQADLAARAIEALPDRQRAALVLRLVEELDYDAIAVALECDVGAVRSSLHLARRKLRQALGEDA